MANVYVYGIEEPSVGSVLIISGIMTDFSVTSSGTEQTLPGQRSCDPNADSGVTDVSTKVSLTVRGTAISQDTLKTITGTVVAVSISSETTCDTGRTPVAYAFNVKVNSAAVTAKARDWWDVKIDGIVQWP